MPFPVVGRRKPLYLRCNRVREWRHHYHLFLAGAKRSTRHRANEDDRKESVQGGTCFGCFPLCFTNSAARVFTRENSFSHLVHGFRKNEFYSHSHIVLKLVPGPDKKKVFASARLCYTVALTAD
jgi:hypothetical protein